MPHFRRCPLGLPKHLAARRGHEENPFAGVVWIGTPQKEATACQPRDEIAHSRCVKRDTLAEGPLAQLWFGLHGHEHSILQRCE